MKPKAIVVAVAQALAEIRHGRYWKGDWGFSAMRGLYLTSRRV